MIPIKKPGTKLAQGFEGDFDKTVLTTRIIRISKGTYDLIVEDAKKNPRAYVWA